jgi:hypothetical protein
MYPAQALFDGLYTYEDLPDTVLGTGIFGDDNVVMSRLNPPQPSIGSTGISYYRGFSLNGSLVGIGLRDGDEWVGTEAANEDAEFGQCLISRLPPDTSGTIADQFADTYTVTINPPDDNAGTYIVTRRSICVWSTQVEESGEPAGLKLSYIDAVFGGGFAYTWEIELDTSYIKDGFANTPTGDYAEGNASVS